ncbi:tetraspanin-1-like [Hemibagrus wyckioides]|uniref:tetraspanin-1-like n=1 Tax=Hemibagrus wyckioides TaxID=337641 RepID=UPI00266CB141|nr:tetraspanin-1-like [Hemibagrus wyckioides]
MMGFKGILKILMVIFNIVIFFAGLASLVIGFRVVINKKNAFGTVDNIEELSPQLSYLANAGYLLVAVGAVLTFIGFLGCCGAFWENQCMLMIAEKLLNNIQEKVTRSIQKGYGENDIINTMWDETMALLKCCGYNNYTDFTGSPYVNHTSQYPQFCCSTGSGKCDLGKAESQKVNGCFDVVVERVKNNSALLGGIAVCVAAIEVGSMIVSFILLK